MPNLVGAINAQIERCRELKKEYLAMGDDGFFGAWMIQNVIDEGEAAIADGKTARMSTALVLLEAAR